MKKSILLTGFLLGSSGILNAQTAGLRAGLNIVTQVWKYQGSTIRPGYNVGTHLGFTLNTAESEKVSGQLELSYSRFGFGEYSDSTGTIPRQSIDYIKLGCAMKYHFNEKINVHAGPELGFGFRSASDLTNLKAPDFGAFVGAEYYLTTYIGFGARYVIGFSDVNDGPQIKQFNRAFQVSILFRFDGRQLKEMGH